VTAAGNGNGSITANVEANLTAVERVANITVNVGGLNPVYVTVTQAGAAPSLVVDPMIINVTAPEGSTSFAVFSNTNWTATSTADWFTVNPSGSGNGAVMIDYQQNTWSELRTAGITVEAEGLDPVVVILTQAAAEAHLVTEPQQIQVTADPGIAVMIIYANVAWTASTNAGWAVVPAGAIGNAAIQITYEQNTGLTPRIAEITVTGDGLTATTILVQEGAEPTANVSPGNINVTYFAGNVSFDVISNLAWTASADSAWLTVTPSGNLSGTLVASYPQNPYYAERVSTISVAVPGKEPQKVTVTQSSSEVSVEETELQGIRVFPNPSKGLFVLEVDKTLYASMEVQVLDLAGHVLISRVCSGNDRYTFDLANLAEGTYSMHIITNKGLITHKLIIIR
jgi:hypothetical protein